MRFSPTGLKDTKVNRKRLTNCTVYDARYFRAAQALGVSGDSIERKIGQAREVKTERFSRTEGKTPAFVEGEVQKLLNVTETSTHTGLRDRALLGVLAYTFARIGAVMNLKVEDYYPSWKWFLLRFKEKGGKEKELLVHHKLEELLDQYLKASGLEKEPESRAHRRRRHA
jgi:site-specific recombinase XerD